MKNKIILGLVCVMFLLIGGLVWFQKPQTSQGSVSWGNEYNATTTNYMASFVPVLGAGKVLKTGAGTLGSVIIQGGGSGNFELFDATTTNVNLRTGRKATTTIYLASFASSTAAGTYTFDEIFSDGLIYVPVDLVGTSGTSTITFR